MQIGMIGLGRMGMNMARRLIRKGHQVVVYNRTAEKVHLMASEGATAAESLAHLARLLEPPRVLWIMLPAQVVDPVISQLSNLLSKEDIVVEGGNSRFSDDPARAAILAQKNIHYLDAGVSGGIWGLEEGYCLMLGGPAPAFARLKPLLEALAPPGGYLHCGPTGAGHFAKMIHNGIEYGMMQAYAEGFELLKSGPYGENTDLAALARLWNHGSVVRSWLLELLSSALEKDPRLDGIKGYVEDSGEGRWTVEQAIDSATPAPVLTLALMQRFRSRQEDTFTDRILAALRNEFGGHKVKKRES